MAGLRGCCARSTRKQSEGEKIQSSTHVLINPKKNVPGTVNQNVYLFNPWPKRTPQNLSSARPKRGNSISVDPLLSSTLAITFSTSKLTRDSYLNKHHVYWRLQRYDLNRVHQRAACGFCVFLEEFPLTNVCFVHQC